jgi:uncharacterized repeat protein (TIGR01451 family)
MKQVTKLCTYFVRCVSANIMTAHAQNAAIFNASVVNSYYKLELQLIKTTSGFTPPVASRAIGYTGLALYEAVVPGIPTYQTSDGVLNGMGPNAITDPGAGPYHWPTVANNALATVIDSLFGNATAANKLLIRNLKDSFNLVFQGQIPTATYTNSLAFGTQVANDVFAHSKTDGGHAGYASNFPASYVLPTGTGLWVPTPAAFAPIPLQPYWGNVRPFLAENIQSPAYLGPHIAFDSTAGSSFEQMGREVYNTVNSLSAGQKNIANYWADGGGTVTPPGHSISILTQIAATENLNLEQAVLAYSKLSMSQMDAFISCWKTKYAYNLMRPVTYIRKYIDPTWSSFIATPPFPEFASGHSTQSGAFQVVMDGIFGSSYTFTDNTHGALHGGARSFTNFKQAAEEAAVSRLYGGIHYRFGNEMGLQSGLKVGQNVNKLFATQLRKAPVTDVAVAVDFSTITAKIGDTVTVTVTVLNQGLTEVSGLSIQNTLPTQLQFLSATPDSGSYNAGTAVWSIPNIAAGVPVVTLKIKGIITADGVPYHLAELTAMNETDTDSAPNNTLLTEDDMKGSCISVPMTACNPNLTVSAPAGYTVYEWFKSTDGGATYQSVAATQNLTITTPGYYLFTVENATLGNCGNQLCCPLIVAPECCPIQICLPITAVRN